MTMAEPLSRRALLTRSLALGCSAAAMPLITPVTLAAAPWEHRLVVIILRGAMDGLDVVQPYGDPELAANRTTLKVGEVGGAHDLDGFFALHPGLSDLMPLWDKGELGFAHAVATPYRDKRSHFDGQDLLEAGTGFDAGVASIRDGWLNRMLQSVPGITAETAFAVGRDRMLVLSGKAAHSNWAPDQRVDLAPQSRRLLEMVYHDDPLFRDAAAEAMELAGTLDVDASAPGYGAALKGMRSEMKNARRAGQPDKLAAFVANRMNAETRIAAFSLGGWDTHSAQTRGLERALGKLQQAILTLRDGLGANWQRTAVLAMTEFGRTARQNGSAGTDHGTGSALLMSGGAIRGGRVFGRWPGLGEGNLYKDRDLMPTGDVRAVAAQAMRGLFGLSRSTLESAIFPGLDMGEGPRIIA